MSAKKIRGPKRIRGETRNFFFVSVTKPFRGTARSYNTSVLVSALRSRGPPGEKGLRPRRALGRASNEKAPKVEEGAGRRGGEVKTDG